MEKMVWGAYGVYHYQEAGIRHQCEPDTTRETPDSSDEFLDHVSLHISQAEVPAGVAEGEFLVVETEQPEDRRVKVMDVNFVFDGLKPEFIRRTVNIPASHAAARQPHAKAVMIMIATVNLAGIGTRFGQLDRGRAAKLTA